MASAVPTSVRARAAALAMTALALAGCSVSRRDARSVAATPEPADVAVGEGLESTLPTAAPGVSAPAGSSAIVITLRDQNGAHPEGIPVKVTGPVQSTLVSDAKGQVRVEGPAGEYTIKVQEGCADTTYIEYAGGVTATVAQGQVRTGELAVQWQRRFAPRVPVSSDIGPAWPVGRTIEVRFDVVDRCYDDRARRTAFPGWRYVPGPNVRIVEPVREVSDDAGRGTIKISCLRAGEAKLVVDDPRNPKDSLDLVAADNSWGTVRPSCR